MKIYNNLSEALFLKLRQELKIMPQDPTQESGELTKASFFTESEVCNLLSVTDRTMRTYRKLKLVGFIKMAGRILYLKELLLFDLVRMYYPQKENE